MYMLHSPVVSYQVVGSVARCRFAFHHDPELQVDVCVTAHNLSELSAIVE